MQPVDLTRRFAVVTLRRRPAAGRPRWSARSGGAAGQVERQLQLALVIARAESVGAMQTAFDMTVEWAFNRYSFGRPLASYQALKHRFADMKSWLEASHAIADAAAAAVASGRTGRRRAGQRSQGLRRPVRAELIHDCVQIHGGIGVTFDHDLHLYLRRHTSTGGCTERRPITASASPTLPMPGGAA